MSDTTTYKVKGMTCVGCANGLAGAFHRSGIEADVTLRAGTATVTGATPAEAVRTAVESAGFQFAGVAAPEVAGED